MSNQTPKHTDKSKEFDKPGLFGSTRKKILVAVLTVVVVFAGLWMWKSIEINDIKKASTQREQALKQRADEVLKQADMQYLKFIAKRR
jgi:hypothetical protein